MLCLAFNVYLSFFRKYDAERLQSLEWKYLIFCYGTPFIPAFVYFFINIAPRGKVYGSATVRPPPPLPSSPLKLTPDQLWCWVSLEWDYLRIAVFYGPVWLIVTITFAIYIYTGAEIFRKRRELRAFAHTPQVLQNPLIGPFTMSKMTEVEVKSEVVADLRGSTHVSGGEDQIPHYSSWAEATQDPFGNTVSIESATAVPVNGMAYQPPSRPNQLHSQHTAVSEAHDAAWSYCRCAILFFIALLVTWVCLPNHTSVFHALILIYRSPQQPTASTPSCTQTPSPSPSTTYRRSSSRSRASGTAAYTSPSRGPPARRSCDASSPRAGGPIQLGTIRARSRCRSGR
jgi:hypothetical protein